MGVIQKEIELAGSKGRKKETALFDSGSTYSCIEKSLAETLGIVDLLLEPIDSLRSLQVGLETAKKEEKLTVDKGGGLCYSDAKK